MNLNREFRGLDKNSMLIYTWLVRRCHKSHVSDPLIHERWVFYGFNPLEIFFVRCVVWLLEPIYKRYVISDTPPLWEKYMEFLKVDRTENL